MKLNWLGRLRPADNLTSSTSPPCYRRGMLSYRLLGKVIGGVEGVPPPCELLSVPRLTPDRSLPAVAAE